MHPLRLLLASNVAVYWGQNSKGEQGSQKRLREYCDDNADIFLLSFLTTFKGTGGYPEVNFAASCNDGTIFPGTGLLHCPQIEQDIQYCQSRGKTILLSLGGAAGSYGFTSDDEAISFADQLWDLFGDSATNGIRPFGDAIVDGFDLDIEGGTAVGYPAFVDRMRTHFNSCKGSNKFYMTAAPQCAFPDYYLDAAFRLSWFDMIFVQFYNNWCDASKWDPHRDTPFNYDQWHEFVMTMAQNNDAKLYLGLPASPSAAGTGYISPDNVLQIAQSLRNYSSFGGVMLWDASQAYSNIGSDGRSFVETIKTGLTGPAVDEGFLHCIFERLRRLLRLVFLLLF